MSAVVPQNGPIRQLDAPAEPDEQVTPEQVQDTDRLARLLMRMLRDLAVLRRRFWPQHIDFEDLTFDSTGTTKTRLQHGFGGRVRWWLVDWQKGTEAPLAPALSRHADTDNNTLVLISGVEGKGTIRVEEAG